MKVLLINTSDVVGGAAVAANRLLNALNSCGVDAKMLVKDKLSDDDRIVSVNDSVLSRLINKFRFVRERLFIFVANKFQKKNLFAVSIANTGNDISSYDIVKDADVIHIHWVNQGFLSLFDVYEIMKLEKPIVWTMHDMWPFTSVCHYAGDCCKYEIACLKCPMLASEWWVDRVYNFKKSIYYYRNLTFVGCSNWIAGLAEKSSLIQNNTIVSVPNAIDTSKFKSNNKLEAKRSLGLNCDKYHILFISQKVTDERKGVAYFIDAMKRIKENNPDVADKIEIIMLGKNSEQISALLPFKTYSLGYVSDEQKIIDIYNAVDVYVTPSMQDNLPNTIMEAMACGVPCVGFNIGGIPEMIDHGKTGYIAEPKDIIGLADGVVSILSDGRYDEYSRNCIEKVTSNYSYSVVAAKYLDVYNNALKRS